MNSDLDGLRRVSFSCFPVFFSSSSSSSPPHLFFLLISSSSSSSSPPPHLLFLLFFLLFIISSSSSPSRAQLSTNRCFLRCEPLSGRPGALAPTFDPWLRPLTSPAEETQGQ
ncbi:unnamed protein product [Gadus morhua 'NCC']